MLKKISLQKLEAFNQMEPDSLGSITIDIPPENFSVCMFHFFTEHLPMDDVSQKYVIDFGTGNGILTLLCAKLGARQILATDASEKSLLFAEQNIADNNLHKKNIKLLCHLGLDLPEPHSEAIDLIVSNPAQIPVSETVHALHNYNQGKEGRLMINEITTYAPSLLNETGVLLMSHSSLSFPETTIDTMKQHGFQHVVLSSRKCRLHKVFTTKEQLDYFKSLHLKLIQHENGSWWYKTFLLRFSRH